jgi:hypothetical protein
MHLKRSPYGALDSKIATLLKLAMNLPGGNIMNVTILQRSVARIDRPTVQTGMTSEHRVRPLIPSGDPQATDPFLLLMEDWFPRGV